MTRVLEAQNRARTGHDVRYRKTNKMGPKPRLARTLRNRLAGLFLGLALTSGNLLADSLADRYFAQMSRPTETAQAAAAQASAAAKTTAITEIAIQQTGPGSQFSASLKADGSLVYQGTSKVIHLGSFSGKIDAAVFRSLAEQSLQLGFFNLKTRYRTFVKDLPTVYISVKTGQGEKIIMDYGSAGPEALRAFEAKVIEVCATTALTSASGGQQ